MRLFLFSCILLSVFSCKNTNELEEVIEKVEVTFNVDRFDLESIPKSIKELDDLKKNYRFLFSSNYEDTFWLEKFSDTLQTELRSEVIKAFPDFKKEEAQLKSLFQHLKYYYPSFNSPRVVTLTSDVDYRTKCVVTDSITLIALDNYLGKEHHYYKNITSFIKETMTRDFVIIDVANEYSKKSIPNYSKKTFLDEIIYQGKKVYFTEKMIPSISESYRIKYSSEQLTWAYANEVEVWKFFVENKLLYSSDLSLLPRFVNPAPFSKFYLEIDNQSPPRLGVFMGYQIVKAYMENNNEVSFVEMLSKDSEEIFRKSRYKPSK